MFTGVCISKGIGGVKNVFEKTFAYRIGSMDSALRIKSKKDFSWLLFREGKSITKMPADRRHINLSHKAEEAKEHLSHSVAFNWGSLESYTRAFIPRTWLGEDS